MKKHNQITLEHRYQISALLNAQTNKTQIALIIGVQRSTVYRELKRNAPARGRRADHNIPQHSQNKTLRRHVKKRKKVILTMKLKTRTAGLMKHEIWSPELIAKR